ncbi:AAA family ATPase [bacterium]|nr:AAA family ATPase [bacterium]MCK5598877.1 AAA family ATPase [bacterium]
MNVEEFFNLKEHPFKTTVDERYYFSSMQHTNAFDKIKYLIDTMGGLSVLIGGAGMGKSMLARRLIMNLNPDQYEFGLIIVIHTEIPGVWLLRQIAKLMGVENADEKDPIGTISKLYARLTELHSQGKKPVILIDEANMLTKKDQMEELRGLTNLEINGQKMINIVLLGIPELEDSLRLDPALAQRVTVKITLGPMQQGEIRNYIEHRIKFAGGSPDMFDPDAYNIIYNITKGIPRLINTLCYNALWQAKDAGMKKIDANILSDVAKSSLSHLGGF